MTTARQRELNTEWARKSRARKWAQKAEAVTRCPAMLANRRPCKTPLQSRFVNGKTVPHCPTCELKRQGVCIECKAKPVYGTKGVERLERAA